jgi:UDP-N-acetylmuramate dehydrogenase
METRGNSIKTVEHSAAALMELVMCRINRERWEEITAGAFRGEVLFEEPMRNHTSLRIGGPADILSFPYDFATLIEMISVLRRFEIPFYPVGGGTNILVKDGGVEGVVISLRSFRETGVSGEDKENVYVIVEAGTRLQQLIRYSRENGYSGIEGLAGIPGTVGGAICGNAGAFGYEMKDVIEEVSVLDSSGRVLRLPSADLGFGYRKSNIPHQALILQTRIRLRKDRKEEVGSRIDDFLKKKKQTQPIWEPSAGCVFKNPPGMAAGKLIDEAGYKGMSFGSVSVSTVHANFFISKGQASASDFIGLMQMVTAGVHERFGVSLEPEIRIIGRE